jgi:hypothetical protein
MVRNTSFSQYKAFAECPRKWELSRKYEPKRKAAALQDGQTWHLVLAKFYGTKSLDAGMEMLKTQFESISPFDGRDAEALAAKRASMEALAATYWKHVAISDLEEFDVLAIEKPFKVRLHRGLYLQGYVDAVFKHKKTGITFIVEHKHQQDLHDELLALDLQVSLYTLALSFEFGILPTLYNVCRKPMYKRSEAKGETPEKFRERVSGLIEEESAEIKWSYDGFDSRFHVRRAYSRGKGDLEAALQQARVMAGHMSKINRDSSLVWRNVGDHCLYRCSFRDICISEDPIVVDERYIPRVNREHQPSINAPAPSGTVGPVI